jgi:O-antigen polymerase
MALTAKPYTWIILLLLPVAAALFNFDLFGGQTLASYFFYTFFAAVAAMFAAMRLLGKNPGYPLIDLPIPVLLFTALALFVFLQGLITHTLNLTHYYWAANAAYFWAAGRLGQGRLVADKTGKTADPARSIGLLYQGVALMALFESLFVCCQELGMLPSKNPLYTCTGTWENPNVTAMFLALAIYAVLQGTVAKDRQRTRAYMITGFILLALFLLKCRTALLVAILFAAGHYWAGFTAFIKNKTGPSKRVIVAAALAVGIAGVLLLTVGVKRDSTQGRIRIWKTSMSLIGQKPITGQGFGLFEKQYNLFTANERLPGNDHVNMPYNDFLELGVEGGLGAVALWAAFLIALWRQQLRQGYSVLPIVAILLIQLTNFGFQALPVFALFLLYAAIPPEASRKTFPAAIPSPGPVAILSIRPAIPSAVLFKYSAKGFRILGVGCIQGIALFLSIHQAALAQDFYDRNIIGKKNTEAAAIEAYSGLAASMRNFVSFHSHYGDAYLKMKKYGPALSQYLQGLETSSNPDLMLKCGYCYQELGQSDSSQYYYTLVEYMEPYKFGPRMALLKLYRQQGDTVMTRRTAEEIVDMPVKIESDEVAGIKNYARKMLEK